jgi:hypothetical protein
MFTSIAQLAKAVAAPALSRALFGVAAYAYAGADHIEIWGHALARMGREAAAPVPEQPEQPVIIHEVLPISALFQRARAEGRVVYTP